uniref:Uncharacterized protein n=1 Tax=Rhizophora mucronata TaxID=61149 RepID=A0A2P2NN12_RHIMU
MSLSRTSGARERNLNAFPILILIS